MVEDNCPHCPKEIKPWKENPKRKDLTCICGKPLLLYIPPGGHVHCSIHPEHVIYGADHGTL